MHNSARIEDRAPEFRESRPSKTDVVPNQKHLSESRGVGSYHLTSQLAQEVPRKSNTGHSLRSEIHISYDLP